MDMDATSAIEPRRCCLCHRTLSSDGIFSGALESVSICGYCKFLFQEDTNSSPESIENILHDENRDISFVGGAVLHRSLATNGRNISMDWLREIASPDSGIGISERRGIDGNLEERVTWRNGVEYVDGENEMDRGGPPASASFVKNLERVVVDDDMEGLVCVICKDSVCVGSVVNRLPCLHVYHGSCIVPWLNAHNTCPLCRYKLPTDGDSSRPNRRLVFVGQSGNVSGNNEGGGGGGGWWFVVAPLVSVVGIGVMLWLGCNRSRRWW